MDEITVQDEQIVDKISQDLGNTEISDGNFNEIKKKKRVPRRILHFSDGTLEEYSTDEDDVDGPIKKTTISEVHAVDPKTLTWGPWFWYKTVNAGSKTLAACDYMGEKLADFFGITSPKYEYEIDHYETLKREKEEKKKQDLEMGGWINAENDSLQTSAPSANKQLEINKQ